MKDDEYQDIFKITPMNWRGPTPIRRNAAIIMGNLGNPQALPHLLKGLRDSEAVVRAHSAWALGEIGCRDVIEELEELLLIEKEEKVIEEIKNAIKKLTP
jgi:epoxyqueuosine reductase